MLGLAQRYGPSMFTAYELGLINGELGIYTAGLPASDGYREMLPRIMAMTVRDGKVCALWDIANPDKFTGSPLRTHPVSPRNPARITELKPCSVMPSAVFIRARMFSVPI